MDDEAWPNDFEETHAWKPDDRSPADPVDGVDAPLLNESAVSFHEQLLRGSWPIRIPVTFEISVKGSRPQVHPLEPGQRRRHPDSQIITLVLQYDRARVRELMLEQIRSAHRGGDSMLVDLIGLAPVDRQCFLETAAAHFADLLGETDVLLRRDRHLYGFVQELHEFDTEVIGDMVAATMRRDRTAGARLRSVILDLVDHPEAREHLGWLATAAITDRLQAL